MSSYASQAFSSIGIPPAQDFSSGILLGAQYCPLTVSSPNEERSSSQSSFLEAAVGRANLRVYSRTLAKRILFDNEKRATGVLVKAEDGTTFILSARSEVILSAGAVSFSVILILRLIANLLKPTQFQSPQLLMVSGIGPPSTLAKYDIPLLVARNSVGQNMWDQPSLSLVQQISLETQSSLSVPPLAAAAAAAYIANRTGILTSNGADFIGWEKLPPSSRAHLSAHALQELARFPTDWPENEMVIGALPFPGTPGANYAIVFADLVAPLSRGNVTIVSADTAVLPVVNPNYLGARTDREVAVQMFRRCRALLGSPAFAPILVGEELVPGPAVQTDAEVLAFLMGGGVGPAYHASCSCTFSILVGLGGPGSDLMDGLV